MYLKNSEILIDHWLPKRDIQTRVVNAMANLMRAGIQPRGIYISKQIENQLLSIQAKRYNNANEILTWLGMDVIIVDWYEPEQFAIVESLR